MLRGILRQDPDVIMVGEICDLETLEVTVQCALTGHLILTTLHANTSPGAIRRLLDVGIEPFLINASLAGVVTQRLVRVLCGECKEQEAPPLHSVPPQAAEFIRRSPEATFFSPKGCEACNGTGYRGRTAIHEILIPDDRVREAVAGSADVAGILNAALAAGMQPMLLSGLTKAAQGITSIQEVCRVVPHGPND
jgi:type II secretory ATPase GspE/PulE/Tfp pilus assembly ATPase PilB-like protein